MPMTRRTLFAGLLAAAPLAGSVRLPQPKIIQPDKIDVVFGLKIPAPCVKETERFLEWLHWMKNGEQVFQTDDGQKVFRCYNRDGFPDEDRIAYFTDKMPRSAIERMLL